MGEQRFFKLRAISQAEKLKIDDTMSRIKSCCNRDDGIKIYKSAFTCPEGTDSSKFTAYLDLRSRVAFDWAKFQERLTSEEDDADAHYRLVRKRLMYDIQNLTPKYNSRFIRAIETVADLSVVQSFSAHMGIYLASLILGGAFLVSLALTLTVMPAALNIMLITGVLTLLVTALLSLQEYLKNNWSFTNQTINTLGSFGHGPIPVLCETSQWKNNSIDIHDINLKVYERFQIEEEESDSNAVKQGL